LAPQVEERLRKAGTVEDVLSHASHEISRASHQLGFAIGAAAEDTTFEHVDFVPLEAGKVLVVLVSTGGHLSHKAIEPAEPYTSAELQQAANYLNTEFKGQSLSNVRQTIVDRLHEERTLYDELMARALRLASSTFEGLDPHPCIYIQGTSLLLDIATADDPETTLATMKTLVRMMEEKTRFVQLLDDCITGAGLTVVIGTEHNERERLSVAESAAADLIADLLPLVDDLERALKADARPEGTDAYRRGVELIHRQLLELLRKRGVRPVEALGADFDPNFHQAVAHE